MASNLGGARLGGLRARVALLMVGLLAVAASAGGLRNGFAYDDLPIVSRNPAVHQLSDLPAQLTETYWPAVPLGPDGRLYRPVTIIAFALQWAIGGGSPVPFHLTSALLYVLISLLVFAVARRFLDVGPSALAAALFAVHPVHTEAVGNVVGQGELLAGVFLLIGTVLFIDSRRSQLSGARIAGIALCYGLACLTKEHAVLWPLLLTPLGWAMPSEQPRARLRGDVMRLAMVLGVVLVVYLSVRHAVLGGLTGDMVHPFWQHTSMATRAITMLSVVPTWARLLLWPSHLQADYAPQEFALATHLGAAQLPGLLLLLAFGALVMGSLRRAPVVAAGLLWLALALGPVTNLIAPTGIVAAERTLFLPSVGLALAIGAGCTELERRASRLAVTRFAIWVSVIPLLALGLWRSATRLPVWRDNTTLFQTTVADAPKSYWAWRSWAGDLVLQNRPDEAFAAYRHSLSLFDRDPVVYDDLASLYRRTGHCATAIPLFRAALAIDSTRHMSASRLIGCLTAMGAFDAARAEARHRVAMGREEFASLLTLVDSAEGRGHLLSPNSARPLQGP